MLLGKWMRTERISNRKLAEMIGGISAGGVNKIRYRQRGPSVRVAARIAEITAGKVSAVDMLPLRDKGVRHSLDSGDARP